MIDFEEHLSDGPRAVVAFAGGNQDRYQWGPTLARLGIPHVLFRDTTQRYYQNGVAGIGGPLQVISYLTRLGRGHDLTLVGVSSGSYGALLYGGLAPTVARVIAISPMTTRNDCDDFAPQWRDRIVDPAQENAPDLRQIYWSTDRLKRIATAFVSDGGECELDRQMAERVGIDNIVLIPGYRHSTLAQGMRDRGLLDEILR